MELLRVVAIKLVQDFDDVCVRIGATERIASAIEAQDKLVWLSFRFW